VRLCFALTHEDQTGIEQVRGQVDFAETMEMENRNGKWKWKWECRKTVRLLATAHGLHVT